MPRVLTDRDAGDEMPFVGDAHIYSWRFDQLTYAGYPTDVAVLLAERADIDLHVACELLEHGASVHLALKILT